MRWLLLAVLVSGCASVRPHRRAVVCGWPAVTYLDHADDMVLCFPLDGFLKAPVATYHCLTVGAIRQQVLPRLAE